MNLQLFVKEARVFGTLGRMWVIILYYIIFITAAGKYLPLNPAKWIAAPDLVKMDIEGAEEQVLKDMKMLFTEKKPVLFVSTHGKQVHLNCVALLKEMGYKLKPLDRPDLETSREILAYP